VNLLKQIASALQGLLDPPLFDTHEIPEPFSDETERRRLEMHIRSGIL